MKTMKILRLPKLNELGDVEGDHFLEVFAKCSEDGLTAKVEDAGGTINIGGIYIPKGEWFTITG